MRNTDPMHAGILMPVFLLLSIGLTLVSCSDEKSAAVDTASTAVVSQSEATQETADTRNTATEIAKGPSMTETSKQGLFQVTLQSDEAPLPLNRIHNWTAYITTPEGRIVDDAIVMVYGGMPEHKHGFPSKPKVTGNLGNGRYRIEGVKFNMPGRWEMWINVRALDKDDKVIFSFDVP
jgi:hypothetical protein